MLFIYFSKCLLEVLFPLVWKEEMLFGCHGSRLDCLPTSLGCVQWPYGLIPAWSIDLHISFHRVAVSEVSMPDQVNAKKLAVQCYLGADPEITHSSQRCLWYCCNFHNTSALFPYFGIRATYVVISNIFIIYIISYLLLSPFTILLIIIT